MEKQRKPVNSAADIMHLAQPDPHVDWSVDSHM